MMKQKKFTAAFDVHFIYVSAKLANVDLKHWRWCGSTLQSLRL